MPPAEPRPNRDPSTRAAGAHGPKDPQAEDAQAALNQINYQAGGALSGAEIRRQRGEPGDDADAPPLDWRLTPRNVILQLLAIALFVAVCWFFVALVLDSVAALFG